MARQLACEVLFEDTRFLLAHRTPFGSTWPWGDFYVASKARKTLVKATRREKRFLLAAIRELQRSNAPKDTRERLFERFAASVAERGMPT